ncbi:MAG: hypothetical protein WKF94_05940 [Solirubrobacteraceae bacterium]
MRNRVAAALGVAVVVAAGVYVLAIRDPLDSKTLYVHDGAPVFTVLYDDEQMVPVAREPGELLRLRGARRELVATLSVRRTQLPPYDGDVVGVLPVFADNYARERGLRLTTDTRARINGAPGYELGYAGGTTLILVPEETPGTRDAIVLTFAEKQPPGRDQGGGQRVSLAMRSALRSFAFGADRD